MEPLGCVGPVVPVTGDVAESSLSLADSKRLASPWRGGMAVIGAVGGACITVGVVDRRAGMGKRCYKEAPILHVPPGLVIRLIGIIFRPVKSYRLLNSDSPRHEILLVI